MRTRVILLSALATLALASLATAQTSSEARVATPIAATASTPVPALIPFASNAIANDGKPLTGEASMTFLIFKDEAGGQPLWAETQIVAADPSGHYTVKLGAQSPAGLPLELFETGTARWLEVQIAGQKPQPRVLLATVPYAAKAADATTLGGLPASAFVLAGSQAPAPSAAAPSSITPEASSNVTTTGGKSHYLPTFTGTSTVADSEIYDSGASVGIGGVPSSSARLDVLGPIILRGRTTMSAAGTATSSKSYPSYGLDFLTGAYNSSTKKAVTPYFALQSEPSGNNTSSPSATFNLRYSNGSSEAETGFYINPNGTLHFAPGQTFPGAGGGVTSVALSAPSSDFIVSGSPVNGKGTLGLSWRTPPTSGNIANALIRRDANGGFSAGVIQAAGLAAGSINTPSLTVFNASNLDGPVTLNNRGTANADFLLLGNTSSRGLQLRDNGTGVDLESIGVPLNVNFVTQQPTFINPNGGQVLVNYNTSGAPQLGAMIVGTIQDFSAYFAGTVVIGGSLNVQGEIDNAVDHPLAPKEKYLAHSAIQSSELLNQYSGNVITNDLGVATVDLPNWFEAENTDFRYQLTVIGGQFAQAIISKKVENNHFTIGTNAPHVEVSWQVTARRNDPYSRAHPLVVERDKPASKKGLYTHPEVYGQPAVAMGK